MKPLAEDFESIAAGLKRIEDEKARVLAIPSPEAAPNASYAPYHGWPVPDYDPA